MRIGRKEDIPVHREAGVEKPNADMDQIVEKVISDLAGVDGINGSIGIGAISIGGSQVFSIGIGTSG